jgi:outer membrane protein TolC
MQDLKKLELEMSLNDLEFWIGRKVDPSEIPLKLPLTYDVIADFQLDPANDLELIRAKNNLKISALDRELAGKERRPDIFLGAGYRVENVTPTNHFSYAIVGINIPIWDTGSSRSEAAKARESRDQKELEEAEKRLKLKHQNQINLVQSSVSQLKRFPKKFILANEHAVTEAEVGFRQSLLDVNTFLQAETQSHEVIDQVFMSWISYLDNLSSLQLMRGEELQWEKQ